MSTTPVPGPQAQPATGWFPALKGTNLPRAAVNGIQQGFTLIYSLRDTVAQLKATVSKLTQYGTHLSRTQTKAQAMPDAAFWFETDSATAFYQARFDPKQTTRNWFYAGGIMYDALSNRPTDLGPHDVGFLFIATGGQFSRWNGTAWTAL